MTYNDIWHRLTAVYADGEAKAVARMLLEEKFGMTLADILCGGVEALKADDQLWLESAVARLERAEPVQYVLGWAWFCGHRFGVAPGVLIPRPETEWLVGEATSGHAASLRVLDIGTGSGCIAISIKKALPGAYVEAWDISPDAIRIATDNARQLSADVAIRRRDALSLPAEPSAGWDVIVSNPPYICHSERSRMADNVLGYEPDTALFVPDADPQLFYRAISRYAATALKGGGRLLFECNTAYAADTARMMRAEGFASVSVCDDCFGMPRFACGVAKKDVQ